MNAKPLAGRTALVTGASRGLGRAIADSLADAGATVYGSSRDDDTAEIIAKRYLTAPVVLEARSAESVRAGVAALLEHSGGVDLLVNNAGINVPRPAVELTETDWDDVLDTNLKGAFLLSTELARHWLAAGTRAAVVNVASQAGIVAIEERAAYGASKAGLIHLTKVLALEWAPHGIRVNAVAPTFVHTELTASTLDRPEWAEELLGRIPLGRFGKPEEIADGVTFLLADTASMITGQTLVIDGGYTIR